MRAFCRTLTTAALTAVLAAGGLASAASAAQAGTAPKAPARQRGAASGMRSTFQNSGTALSIGVFFSLMIAGLASTLPTTLTGGLRQHGVSASVAQHIGSLPPVSSLFASVLGVNPLRHLLSATGELARLPLASQRILTGREFFPDLIAGPFHHGLGVVFGVAAALAGLAAVASLLRGGRYVHPGTEAPRPVAPARLAARTAARPSETPASETTTDNRTDTPRRSS